MTVLQHAVLKACHNDVQSKESWESGYSAKLWLSQMFTPFSSCIHTGHKNLQATSEQGGLPAAEAPSVEQMCVPVPHSSYLGHLLLPLRLGGFGVSVVVCLNDDQVIALRVNDKFSGCVLQWEGNLVEDCPQLLQCQNPEGQKCDMD